MPSAEELIDAVGDALEAMSKKAASAATGEIARDFASAVRDLAAARSILGGESGAI